MSRPHIGIDEAGRGCLAGPVVAAAVLFPQGLDSAARFPGLTDSKKLSAAKREALYPLIRANAVWAIGLSWPGEIDTVNILNATFRAMARAASRLRYADPLPCLLIDGNHRIRENAWQETSSRPLPQQYPIIKGDSLVPAISAASVLAKVFRDKLMTRLERRYPGYGFAAHKGYGTQEHRDAVAGLGFSAMHRTTFNATGREKQGNLL
ncbi:ribonuclease HII [Desulfovibrio sp. OttesenSCG-928-I05]|nr:ribonuclease HII [Desulfovibrio sp. OttesenSCG-928-I05]